MEVTLDEGEPADLLPRVVSGEIDVAIVYRFGLVRQRLPAAVRRLPQQNYAVIRGLVATGLGIAIVPALGHEPTAGVTSTRLSDPLAHRDVFAVRLSRATEGPWRHMLAALPATAHELVAEHPTLRLPG